MGIRKISIKEFIELRTSYPIFDVRSPSEYTHGHIPEAHNLAIFNDEQRAEIGTAYKKQNRETAIKIGFKYFGPMINQYIQTVEQILKVKASNQKSILVHCWRGGMRSAAMAWVFDFYGFDVMVLEGGYKAYRNYVLSSFELALKFNVLGGYTGSAKTEVLLELKKQGHAVVDLEGLAAHKGSSFGGLGMPTQPSQEQFENNLHQELSLYYQLENDVLIQKKNIWIENESQRIGLVNIPKPLFNTIHACDLYILNVPFEARLAFIQQQYGSFSQSDLVSAVMRIQKKLGGLDTKIAIQFLLDQDTKSCFELLLNYYDRQYHRFANFANRKNIEVNAEDVEVLKNVNLLLNLENGEN